MARTLLKDGTRCPCPNCKALRKERETYESTEAARKRKARYRKTHRKQIAKYQRDRRKARRLAIQAADRVAF